MNLRYGLFSALLGLAGLPLQTWAAEQTVVGGAGNDYQVSVAGLQAEASLRLAVFERLNGAFSGDLWLTRSQDGGLSWSEPVLAVGTAANERHPSLLSASAGGWLLFHLSNAGGSFRIHRATSMDGLAFTPRGALALGWASGGEINPQVIRLADGRLLLSYHRSSGAAHVALSSDEGETWDQQRTQVSLGAAALPRIAQRPSDGRLLLVYQTNPGNNQLQLWARSSLDPLSWTDSPELLTPGGNNHDAWPLWREGSGWQLYWARVADGGFQIHRSASADLAVWTMPENLSNRPGLANVQPHVLATSLGTELYWGAAQVAGDSNYDIVRRVLDPADTTVFGDGFEAELPSEPTRLASRRWDS